MFAKIKEDFVSIGSLFTSVSTLLCCALPSLLVALGMGAVVAGLASDLPWLITMSKYKDWTFLIAGIMIGFNFWLFYGRKRNQTKSAWPSDTKKGRALCPASGVCSLFG